MTHEPILDPARPIVDAHHHLYDRPGLRYLAAEYRDDLASGHNVGRTVYVQARHAYDAHATDALRPVGETRFARAVADEAEVPGGPAIAAAIVPFADLMNGDGVRPVLEQHLSAGAGRVRGIRHVLAWDADARLRNAAYPTTEDMMDSERFRQGFRHLAPLNLSFDAWLFHAQLGRLARLSDAFPDTRIVIDHCGGPVHPPTPGSAREVFPVWRAAMADLAKRPNVFVKLSGLGMPMMGLRIDGGAERRPDSAALAAVWAPWMDACIDLFGAKRAMFASNFPADRPGYDYAVGWNAMKRITAGGSESEKDWLFARTAETFYRLNVEARNEGSKR